MGLADRSCAVHDLATAIERSAVAWLLLGRAADDAIADAAAARSLIDGYDSVLPLGTAAINAVVRLLPLIHMEFALSEVAYFAGVLGDTSSAALAWDGYLLGHARWFQSVPGRDFPRIAELYLAGKLPVDELISHRIGLEDVNEAFDAMRRGERARSVIVF